MTVRAILAVLAFAGIATSAQAQDACRRYRAELASLERGASHGASSAREAAQLTAYYRSIGCENTGFLFFDNRPAQCGTIAQRIRALSTEDRVEIDTTARRRHLRAAIAQACDRPKEPREGEWRTAAGGGQVICVRTCDGGYFPMNNLPDGRGGADALCQALCPGTQAVAYSMPQGDEALSQAAAIRDRRAYSALPNAYKFRTSFSQDCSCRREGESWTKSLAKAERMLDRHDGDMIVTAARAEELSRPKITPLSRAALAKLKRVPVGGTTVVTKAEPVTTTTATLAARQTGAESAGTAAAKTKELEARTETTGTVKDKPEIRVIPTPPARR